jgi:hypothetical protein
MSVGTVSGRKGGPSSLIGGSIITGLGISAAIHPGDAGPAWLVIAASAAGLLVVGLLGLRTLAAGVQTARRALAGSSVAMGLFALAHLYALTGADLAFALFTVFMVAASAGLITAGVALLRSGWQNVSPLVCGIWPVVTIPAGAAIGDVPHFLAIAGWGVTWVVLGVQLSAAARERSS